MDEGQSNGMPEKSASEKQLAASAARRFAENLQNADPEVTAKRRRILDDARTAIGRGEGQ